MKRQTNRWRARHMHGHEQTDKQTEGQANKQGTNETDKIAR